MGGGCSLEKSLEHFLANALLDPSSEDTVFEIAMEESPFSDLVSQCTDAQVRMSGSGLKTC